MDDETFKKQAQCIAKIVPLAAQFIEEKAKEFCDSPSERKNLILSCCVNLLGNLAMHLSEDTFDSKLKTSACTVEKLMEWYKISMTEYRIKKEAH